MTARTYSMSTTPVAPTSGTGLDQLVDIIDSDPGLAGANKASDIAGGAAAADGLNRLIVEAAVQTGAASDGKFTADEVVAMNAYIRAHRLDEWTALHGDDEDGVETGFHLVQGDGATTPYRGQNAVNTVADGLYHLGFEIVDGRFLNEDGNANASVGQVAKWLTQFWTDHSTTGTGLDRIVDLMMADGGLARTIPQSQIEAGANAADGLNTLLVEAIASTGVAQDGWISTEDAVTLNAYVRANHLAEWTLLHGDDNGDEESGYHVVQNDGATTQFFGRNLFDTVADGLYHLGFEIVNGRFLNEDDNQNGSVANIASYLNYFFTDLSTTNTGLDRIVDTIKIDRGLSTNTPAANINEGAKAADNLNHLLVDAIQATNAMADGWITTDDLYAINAWVRSDAGRLALFTANHGDDENGTETGYHLVQGDGATTRYFGLNLVDTVADGLYHFGFEIEQGRFVNEDGNANASLTDVASWLNYFHGNRTVIIGGDSSETINGSADAEMIVGHGGGDTINAGGGDDLVDAGDGNDTVNGGAGDDILYGGLGRDTLDGGDDSDLYRVSGNAAEGWPSFQDYDTYKDTGASGIDVIQAIGAGDVDIAVRSFVAAGIEVIDGSMAAGKVRLLGDWTANVLDFGATSFVGGNIVIDADSGNDTIYGTAGDDTVLAGYGNDKVYAGSGNDRVVAGGGNDTLDGQDGSDTYEVTGNRAGGWESFQDYDTYKDTGTGPGDVDTIKAIGAGDVDIGLLKLDAASGIERIDGSAAAGTVRLIADWTANVLDFRATSFVGGNIVIDADGGNDTVFGTDGKDRILGRSGHDVIDGGAGDDAIAGGEGKDVLTGGLGADHFVFDTGLSAGVDKIVDLAPGIDLIELAAAIFGSLGGPGVLSADQFVIGSKALDGNDHVLYNAATGVLSYDADGNGAGGAIAFAQLLTGLSLGASDFLVI